MADTDWNTAPPYGASTKVPPKLAVNLATLLQQSVPTGVEGDTRSTLQRYSDAYDQPEGSSPLARALMTYGDKVIIPSLEETPGAVGNAVLDTLNAAGDLSLAYGPPNLGPAGPAAMTLGMMLKAPQAAARMISRIAPSAAPEVAATQKASTDALNALSDEITATRASRAETQASKRDAAYQAANPNLGPTVPNVDGITPIRERNQVLDAIQGNPFVQPIKGRQGLPTKAEQTNLANQYFDNSGRLGPGGPWGRDMQQEIRDVLSKAARKADNQSVGPTANKPGPQEMGKGLNYFRNQAGDAERALQEETFKRYQAQRKLLNLKHGIEE